MSGIWYQGSKNRGEFWQVTFPDPHPDRGWKRGYCDLFFRGQGEKTGELGPDAWGVAPMISFPFNLHLLQQFTATLHQLM